MGRIIISEPAKQDIADIFYFIKKDNPKIAKNFLSDLLKKISLLEQFPKLGKSVQISRQRDLRTLIHLNYRIIYRIRNGDIDIVRVLHTSRLFDL